MAQWLVKSEPEVYSIHDLKRDRQTAWDGVRNYQARNFLMNMKVGDSVLFYHSSTEPCGVVGVARVQKTAEPDALQFNSKSEYFDPKATREKPRWFAPKIEFVSVIDPPITLTTLKERKTLSNMLLLQRGSRLSVQPVSDKEYREILKLAKN